MPEIPPETGYAFPGMENLHNDIYPAISATETSTLAQKGKVVLITGAGRGIGRAIALQYAHASVASIIISARTSSQLDEVESSIKKINAGIRVHKFTLDVSKEDEVAKCAAEVKEKEGKLDVLVNNAGGSSPWESLEETTPKDWWKTFEVNLYGPYLFIHAFLPLLVSTAEKEKRVTDIVNISSIGGNMVMPGASAYQISKLAVQRLTEFVEKEYAGKGVNAVGVHPGGVPTELGTANPALKPFMIDTPELCGGFVVWLTAGARTWLSGRYVSATWNVDKLSSMKDEILAGDKLRHKLVV